MGLIMAAASFATSPTLLLIISASIGIVAAVTAPMLLYFLTARLQRKQKLLDYARQDQRELEDRRRQDEVARNAAEQAESNHRRQDEVARRAAEQAEANHRRQDEVARTAAETAQANLQTAEANLAANERNRIVAVETSDKLDTVHTLVNGQMTSAMQSELDAITRELVMMKELISLHKEAGKPPTRRTLADVRATERKLKKLSTTLKERYAQHEIVKERLGEGR